MATNDLSQLTDLFAKTKVVQINEVSFSGSGFKLNSAEDAKEIVDKIRNAKDVEALRLEGNTVGVEAAKAIADALKDRKEFQKAFWSDMFTGRLRSEIPPSLEVLGNAVITSGAHLTLLDLSDNAFGPDGVKGIRQLLMSQACYTLEVLKLNNNGLGIGGGKLLSDAFLECHKRSSAEGQPFALKVFISGRNRLENEGAKSLAAAFKVIGSLEEIQMPQNGIQHSGISALADALAFNANLKVLNLNDNICTEKGALSIVKSLPRLSKLETLNLGDCLLRNKGAEVIAEALTQNVPFLKELIVSFNEIRQQGGIAMCESLENKHNLSLFNIDGNQLGDGIALIEEKMKSYGKEDALKPFEENEEPDSDDEEEGSDEEDEEDEEEDTDEDKENENHSVSTEKTHSHHEDQVQMPNGVDKEENHLLTNGVTIPNGKVNVEHMAEEFLRSPSMALFSKLPEKQQADSVRHAAKLNYSSLNEYARLFVQVSGVLLNEEKARGIITDAIFPDLISIGENKPSDVAGALLTELGLLKSEHKVHGVLDVRGPFLALIHACQQPYWVHELSEYFIVFLTKPNKVLDRCPDERHHLLQKLYLS